MKMKEALAAHQVVNFHPKSLMELNLSQRNAKGFEQALGVSLHAARKPTRQTQTAIGTAAATAQAASTAAATGATAADTTTAVTVSASTLLNLPGRKSLLELEPRLFAGAHEEHEALVLLEPGQQKRH